jgi:hypothetical protein
MFRAVLTPVCAALAVLCCAPATRAEGDWEITPQSEQALRQGLDWLARNQGPEGNWGSNNLGLVSLGALAFLADGHTPGHGKYGDAVERALNYVLKNAKPSGLLNINSPERDMYNHGLSAFALGQAHGMTNDKRISPVLDRALKLIANTQCNDGGWDYKAKRLSNGHDLSLTVMQAKALRSAVDSGLEVPPEVIDLAIKDVRLHYSPEGKGGRLDEMAMQQAPGQFTYSRGGGNRTLAMAACGVVCLQEFGQYDDWRIPKSMVKISQEIKNLKPTKNSGKPGFDPYTLYYVGQAIYQVGGNDWQHLYPILREALVTSQTRVSGSDPANDGKWISSAWVAGKEGDLYATSVGCFILAMPNRYLPILQEGRINSLQKTVKAGE